MPRLAALRARLDEGVGRPAGGDRRGQPAACATIGAVALPGASSASLLVQFDLAGIAVSAGSACSSGKHEGKRGARRDGRAAGRRRRFLRISFGPATSEADVDALPRRVARIAARRARAA
jgi:cysteine desulfurase